MELEKLNREDPIRPIRLLDMKMVGIHTNEYCLRDKDSGFMVDVFEYGNSNREQTEKIDIIGKKLSNIRKELDILAGILGGIT